MVAFAGLMADPLGCAGVQLSGPGRAVLGITSLGLPSKGELGGRQRGKKGLSIDCPTETIGLKLPSKALGIVSDMGPGLETADGSHPVTRPSSRLRSQFQRHGCRGSSSCGRK